MSCNPPANSCPNGFIYIVQPGDTLFVLANRFSITVNELIAANTQLTNPNTLCPGDRLCIPKPTSPSCPGGTIYQVQSGDTIFFIAQKFGVTVEAIISANPQLSDPNVIFPGQLLCIPVPGSTTTPQPPSICPTLTVGSTGSDVIRLQTLLLSAGFNPGPIDGIFGPLTLQAVINFQIANGLTPDGVVGVQTWTALGVDCSVPPTTIVPPPACPNGMIFTIQSGDTLSAISNALGICLESILIANPGIDPNNLQIGQKICIPGPVSCSGTLYTVVSGDTLSSIATNFHTTVNAILAANPQICNENILFIGEKICIPGLPPTTTPPSACTNGFIYTIKAGDTLSGIANSFGICLEEILTANPGIDPNNLQIGQQICIPGPSMCSGTLYTVVSGDTLSSIANMFSITVNDILSANPQICNENVLFIGEKVCIPATLPTTSPPPSSCINGFIYTIQPGDTLSGISSALGICLDAILAANPGINPNNLQIGQQICIPGPTTSTGTIYTVAQGDTLSIIASGFNTTVDAILAVNPQICNENVLFVGEKISIPTGPTIPPTTQPPSVCPTLFPGDVGPDVVRLQTLLLTNGFNPGPIDGIFGPQTENAVIQFQTANNLTVDGIVGVETWTALGVDCELPPTTVPPTVVPPECPNGFIYTIVAGDTLSGIANKTGICLDAILIANPGIEPTNLQMGQKICIPGPETCSGIIHTVIPGDTLSGLAVQFNTSVQTILANNPQICNENVLFVGEKICIPSGPTTPPTTSPPPPSCENGIIFIIQSGDTLSSISDSTGICITAIEDANPGIDPFNLQIGQKICIPGPTTCSGTIYTIHSGDTLSHIANMFNTTVNEILAVNPQICNEDVLFVGEKICIPVSAITTPSTTIPPTNTPPPTLPPCVNGMLYTIEEGDTIFGIGEMFGLIESFIIVANPQIDPENLIPGEIICIPGPVCTNGFTYVVIPDDTLSAITDSFGITVADILNVNPQIANPDVLFVGEIICIPSFATAPPVTTEPPSTSEPPGTAEPPSTGEPPCDCEPLTNTPTSLKQAEKDMHYHRPKITIKFKK